MKKWILWTAVATLVIAVVAHVVTVVAIPNLIMNAVMAKGPTNVLFKGGRTTAENRLVVRPCPDFVYSGLSYDLTKGPIWFTAQVPADNYWSVSFYQQNTDNYFVINDRQIKSNPIKLLLVKQGTKYPDPGHAQIVVSPSDKGIMLVRHLLVSDDKFDQLVKIQNQSSVKVGNTP